MFINRIHRLFESLSIAVVTATMISGCAVEEGPNNPFINHWKQEQVGREGFSPSAADLSPEPRVILRQESSRTLGQNRPLPTKPVTIKLQQVSVVTAIRALAQAAGVSVMISPKVAGEVDLSVNEASWNSVFLSILKANGLDYRWEGKVMQVITLAERQQEMGMLQLSNQLSEQYRNAEHSGPLSVSILNVRYSDAESLKNNLQKFVTRNRDAVIEIDPHNNALIIQATKDEMTRLLALVEHLDRPRPQVLLKAYIIETTKQKARELGVQWGGAGRFRPDGSSTHNAFVGGGSAVETMGENLPGFIANAAGLGYGSEVSGSGIGTLAFGFGHLGRNILEAQLNMLEKEGELNILSSPSITTLDNKMAYTENGEKVPYISKDDDGDNDVKFEEAVLRLEMTPNVIDPNNLKLKVLIKKDEVDMSRSVEGNPFIVKKQTETTLICRSGETIVISGLTKETGTSSEAGVPALRRLPGGNVVFGSTNKRLDMQEVMIFITPEILPVRQGKSVGKIYQDQSPSVMLFEGDKSNSRSKK